MLAAFGALAGACAEGAQAQRLLVTTQTLSVLREAAAVYVHSIDAGWGAPLPGAWPLPEVSPSARMALSPDGTRAALTTGPPPGHARGVNPADMRWHSVWDTAPFAIYPNLTLPPSRDWEEHFAAWMPSEAAGAAPGAARGDFALLLAGHGSGAGRIGRARLHVLGEAEPWAEWLLPGPPAGGVFGERWHILCDAPEGAAVTVIDPLAEAGTQPETTVWPALDSGVGLDAAPRAIAATGDGRHLLVLASGYRIEAGSAPPVSWLHVLDAETLAPVSAPLEMPGLASPAGPALQPAGQDRAWITTATPGTTFAHATLAAFGDDGARKLVVHPLTGVTTGLLVAPSPDGVSAAAAIDNRYEYWPRGLREGASAEYPEPFRVLRWTDEGLFGGEAGRLHALDPPTGASYFTHQFQSGHVSDIVLVPLEQTPQPDPDGDGLRDIEELRLGTQPLNPDSDGDGIPDGSDPEPRTPSPRLELPAQIVFRGQSVGRELRAIAIRPEFGEQSAWHVTYDREAMPWLIIRPLSGRGWGAVYMGIDPARWDPEAGVEGVITVSLEGTRPGIPAAYSPRDVVLTVTPAPSGPPRILWLWDREETGGLRTADDARGLNALADLLAGPPNHFAHTDAWAPYHGPLDPYAIVVVSAAAAEHGAVTRQALLEYVAGGGALLFLGEHLPETSSGALLHWLRPLGIAIDAGARVDGRFTAETDHPLTRHWGETVIQNGIVIRVEDSGHVLAAGEAPKAAADSAGQAVFAALAHGYGRIALLAGASPLQSAALGAPGPRLFALELFQWLARAGYDVADMDGDGIPDHLEDRNNNGQFDPGETDFLNPDTDGDGIPDGMEDLNRNGIFDEGETDPRNPDTDGDGIWDGADPRPALPAGAPAVLRIEPEEGPAEGGRPLLIHGRNLTPDCQFWFGEQMVENPRILSRNLALALAPAQRQIAGGVVGVRAECGGAGQTVLPNAFRYTPRTRVRLAIVDLDRGDGKTHGVFHVRLDAPAEAPIRQVFFLIEASPHEGLAWEAAPAAAPPGARAPELVHRALEDGVIIVVVTAQDAGAGIAPGDLLEVSWTRMNVPPEAMRFTPIRPSVQTPRGELLVVETEPLAF